MPCLVNCTFVCDACEKRLPGEYAVVGKWQLPPGWQTCNYFEHGTFFYCSERCKQQSAIKLNIPGATRGEKGNV